MKNFIHTDSRVCRRIRTLTAERGWTRTELSKRSGVSYRLVHAIMHENASLRDDTLGKLAKALEMSVEDLSRAEGEDSQTGMYPEARSSPLILRDAARSRPGEGTLMDAIETIAGKLGIDQDEVLKAIFELSRKGDAKP